jgi:hypothetical protein
MATKGIEKAGENPPFCINLILARFFHLLGGMQ